MTSFYMLKQRLLKTKKSEGEFNWDDLSEAELKQKAILGNIGVQYKKRVSYQELLAFLPDVVREGDTSDQRFWSSLAGDLDDSEAVLLIDALNEKAHYGKRDNLILAFALKNGEAWKYFNEKLKTRDIKALDLLYALSEVPKIDDKFLLLMHRVLGEKFTQTYIENKRLIDKTPRKYHFVGLTDHNLQVNFLDAFTKQLKQLTASFGEDPSEYACLSNALGKEGFREAARELMLNMLAYKEKYICEINNHNSNAFIRESFPELVTLMEKDFPPYISYERIKDIVRICFKEKQVAELLNSDEEINEKYPNLPRSLIEALPSVEQAKKAIEIRGANFGAIVQFAKIGLPEWMYDPVEAAVSYGTVSLDRLGNKEKLFDAAKTWKINPKIGKREAEKIGKMPLEVRIVACAIYDKIINEKIEPINRHEQTERFWQEMKKAQDMGWKEAILHYCSDNAETRGRILSIFHPEIDDEKREVLQSCVDFKHLVDFNMDRFNNNARLLHEYLGISLPFQTLDNNKMLKRIVVFDKFFPNEAFRQKFLAYVKDNSMGNSTLFFLQPHMSDKKIASFAKFLEKNLFFDDGSGTEVMRSVDQLKAIAQIWENLTPQQEQYNFSKLLGLCYTHKTIESIESQYESIRTGSRRRRTNFDSVIVPDNLRLYQKMLLTELNCPVTQEEVDDLLSLSRQEGMERLVRRGEEKDDFYKRKVVDLIIGNDAQINDFERHSIAGLSPENILAFRSKRYKEIVDRIIEMVTADPKADDLFRKYYEEMVADSTMMTNQEVIKVREHYQSNRDWIVPSALRIMTCFGNDYERYLNKIARYNLSIKKQIDKKNAQVSTNDIINIHDALYWLPLDLKPTDRASFMELIDKYLFYDDGTGVAKHRNFADFEIIAKAWSSLTDEERKSSYKDLLATIRSKKYVDSKYNAFAEEAARWGVSEGSYKVKETIYEQGLQVPELIDSSKRFPFGNLIGRFLARDDPRVGFFGKYTDCCQHFDSAGRSCAISSIRDPFSQLFVVEDAKGRIVAGSWVWSSKIKKGDKYFNALCFDNIEAIGDYKYSKTVMGVYNETLPYLAELNYAKVTVGMGFQDGLVSHLPNENNPVPLNKNYSGYTDAHTQKVMMDNPNAKPVDYNEGDIYITGALESDISAMQAISQQCFPDSDRNLQMPSDDPQGLLLKDKGKIVGYVVWSEKERSIYDMAVLPEYRKDKNYSSYKLLNEMARKIKKIGGEWSAELRDNTSLRYMKAMAGRGLIDLEVGKIDHEMSDGTKVYSVKFSVKDKPEGPRQTRPQINIDLHEGR